MEQQNIFDYINVDGLSLTPKYIQLANSIQDAVVAGKIQQNRILPSLHELTYHLEISKETADRGYKYLRDRGVLSSVPGKGHFVTAGYVAQPHKIFMLLNKLSDDKKLFYDVFADALGESVTIDLYIYNDDYAQFKKLLETRKDGYTHYIILPNFPDSNEKATQLINALPKDKLILLEKNLPDVKGGHGVVYNNFKRNIYNALESVLSELKKYDTIKILTSPNNHLSAEIIWGFNLFCQQHGFDRSIINSIAEKEICKGEVYIVMEDEDLVSLVEKTQLQGLEAGVDVGIISYEESPLKSFILKGITTLSTNFRQMGLYAANMVLQNKMDSVELDCQLIQRRSL